MNWLMLFLMFATAGMFMLAGHNLPDDDGYQKFLGIVQFIAGFGFMLALIGSAMKLN